MTLNEICALAEVIQELGLGSSITNADRALLESKKNRVENLLRKVLRFNISQPTSNYIHFLPERAIATDEGVEFVETVGPNNRVIFGTTRTWGDVLQLPQTYVRSITEVREDPTAYGGQGSSAFPSDSVLTEGDDYWLDVDESGLSKTGHVLRAAGIGWSGIPRSIRVSYMAGLTAAELDGEYSNIKEAVINETITRFKIAKSRSGANTSGVGPIKSESIGGQYSVSYDTSRISESSLSAETLDALSHYMNLSL
jgi:hypothetical protein